MKFPEDIITELLISIKYSQLHLITTINHPIVQCVFHLVPGNVTDVNHSVEISGDNALIKITFQVSLLILTSKNKLLSRILTPTAC